MKMTKLELSHEEKLLALCALDFEANFTRYACETNVCVNEESAREYIDEIKATRILVEEEVKMTSEELRLVCNSLGSFINRFEMMSLDLRRLRCKLIGIYREMEGESPLRLP